jgi:aspartate ammonia-lyase
MSETRIEKDLLGSMEVPADAYYGVHTQPRQGAGHA